MDSFLFFFFSSLLFCCCFNRTAIPTTTPKHTIKPAIAFESVILDKEVNVVSATPADTVK